MDEIKKFEKLIDEIDEKYLKNKLGTDFTRFQNCELEKKNARDSGIGEEVYGTTKH
jgi:hypothetical protein